MNSKETSLYREIGERILKKREDKGESQTTLAQAIGCKQTVISKIENGEISINASRLNEIAKHYDVSCDFLLSGIDANNSLSLLPKFIQIEYDDCPCDDTTIHYPVLKIDSDLINYLFQIAQSESIKNLPEKARVAWHEAAKKQFTDANHTEKIAFIPFPEAEISKDNSPNSWNQKELLEKSNQNLTTLFS